MKNDSNSHYNASHADRSQNWPPSVILGFENRYWSAQEDCTASLPIMKVKIWESQKAVNCPCKVLST